MTYDWYKHALDIYRKKYTHKPIMDYNERAKRSRFMQQRGFSSAQIQYAMSERTMKINSAETKPGLKPRFAEFSRACLMNYYGMH